MKNIGENSIKFGKLL